MTASASADTSPAGPGLPAPLHRLAMALEGSASPCSLASRVHGREHWNVVARVGVELAARTPGADVGVILLFALAHDTRRRHDDHDPDHGRRAAAAARALAEAGVLDLAPGRLELLCRACAGHADGLTSADPTIGACWDADRLNLWRVGLAPARRLLSTAAARSAKVYDWSRGVHAGDVGWPELLAEVTGWGVGWREVGGG